MSRFDSFSSDEIDEPIGGRKMNGAFSCQTCEEVVTTAKHDPREDTLTWKCSNGHMSRIGFKI